MSGSQSCRIVRLTLPGHSERLFSVSATGLCVLTPRMRSLQGYFFFFFLHRIRHRFVFRLCFGVWFGCVLVCFGCVLLSRSSGHLVFRSGAQTAIAHQNTPKHNQNTPKHLQMSTMERGEKQKTQHDGADTRSAATASYQGRVCGPQRSA